MTCLPAGPARAHHLDWPRPLLLPPHIQPKEEERGLEVHLLHVSFCLFVCLFVLFPPLIFNYITYRPNKVGLRLEKKSCMSFMTPEYHQPDSQSDLPRSLLAWHRNCYYFLLPLPAPLLTCCPASLCWVMNNLLLIILKALYSDHLGKDGLELVMINLPCQRQATVI